jgi:hypothetical protein
MPVYPGETGTGQACADSGTEPGPKDPERVRSAPVRERADDGKIPRSSGIRRRFLIDYRGKMCGAVSKNVEKC